MQGKVALEQFFAVKTSWAFLIQKELDSTLQSVYLRHVTLKSAQCRYRRAAGTRM